MLPKLVTPPAETPISLTEVKRFVQAMEFSDDDTLLNFMIASATSYLDAYDGILGAAIVAQTWSQSFERVCGREIEIPVVPLIQIVSVKYFDEVDVEQTFDASNYRVHADGRRPYIKLKPGSSWPSTSDRDDAITITWQAGFGAATDVPYDIKAAMLHLIFHWYINREAVNVGQAAYEVPLSFNDLIAPIRWRYLRL